MRILLPIDGSRHSAITIDEFLRRPWPSGTQVEVLSVAVASPLIAPTRAAQTLHFESLEMELSYARRDAEDAAARIRSSAPALEVSAKIAEGSPVDAILAEAAAWHADLILMGSHGRGVLLRHLLGSVADTVSRHAPCSVEIVRDRQATAA
jgi:nucleotide-binding universal stress UspA family protein